MKKHEKQEKEINAFIEGLGAEKLELNENGYNHKGGLYTHAIETFIGPMYCSVDCEGEILSLFCNFLDNSAEAKRVLGHWKQNIHERKESGLYVFKLSIQEHIDSIKQKCELSCNVMGSFDHNGDTI